MNDVAIVGAGALGGAVASAIAALETASAIRLIDETGSIAAGKALDIAQSAPILGFSTKLSGTTDLAAAAGAAIIIVADCAARGEWEGEEGMQLLKRLSHVAAGSTILFAGTKQRELVERSVREAGFARPHVLGSSPEALAGAARAVVALEANTSANDVSLTVLGVPPRQLLIPWDDVTIGGFAATRVLNETARRRLSARIAALWPPGATALAAAAAKVAAALLGHARHRATAFVPPDDTQGRRSRAAALPVTFGNDGAVRVEMPTLNAHDQVVLDNAMLL